MIKKIKRIILAAAACSMILTPAFATVSVAAQNTKGDICAGVQGEVTPTDCPTGAANNQISKVMKNVIGLLSLLTGIVAVIMIIIGGFEYVTSNGDTGKISTAKNTIIFALVGLIIVAIAQFIVHFVLGKVVGY